MLLYHQPILDFLQIAPSFSLAIMARLDQRERELGIRFPASFREWYSLEGAWELIYRDGRWQHPVPIEHLGASEYDDTSILVFMWENQAVWCWGICLDVADDPPVHLRYNEPDYDWELYADHFSTFIHIYLRRYWLIQLNTYPFTMKVFD